MLTVNCDFCTKQISPKDHHRIEIRNLGGSLFASGDICQTCAQKSLLKQEVIVPVKPKRGQAVADNQAE